MPRPGAGPEGGPAGGAIAAAGHGPREGLRTGAAGTEGESDALTARVRGRWVWRSGAWTAQGGLHAWSSCVQPLAPRRA